MKNVHIALGIHPEYREWRWLLSPLPLEKCGMPPREEIRQIKAEAFARPITVVEPTAYEGGKKRFSPPTQEMPAEKKPKTSFAAREGSLAAPKLVIDLTFSKCEKEKAAKSVLVTPTILKVASSIADMIA
ncbi:hypothetical protein PS2_022719 [Malus domestica]